MYYNIEKKKKNIKIFKKSEKHRKIQKNMKEIFKNIGKIENRKTWEKLKI